MTTTTTLYNDTYKGPRWRYRSDTRPFLALPVVFVAQSMMIVFSQRPSPESKHGTMDFAQPIDEFTARQFDLVLVETLPATDPTMQYGTIGVGSTVIRLPDRKKDNPSTGTVVAINGGLFGLHATVRWEGKRASKCLLIGLMPYTHPDGA